MPKGYVIVTEAVRDPAGMAAYGKLAGPSLAEFGAKVLVVDEDVDAMEGEWPGSRVVVLEFESVDKAREWYRSAGYQAAAPLRQAAADCNLVIVSGLDPRS